MSTLVFALGCLVAVAMGYVLGRARSYASAYRHGYESAAQGMVRPSVADERVVLAECAAHNAVAREWAEDSARQQRRFRGVLREARRWKRVAGDLGREASRAAALEGAWYRTQQEREALRQELTRALRETDAHRRRAQVAKSAAGVARGERDRAELALRDSRDEVRQLARQVFELRGTSPEVSSDGGPR